MIAQIRHLDKLSATLKTLALVKMFMKCSQKVVGKVTELLLAILTIHSKIKYIQMVNFFDTF